jgi:hypothetical protein
MKEARFLVFGDSATRYLGAPLELLCGRERGRCERGGEEEELFEHRCRGDALIWELRGDAVELGCCAWVLLLRRVLQRAPYRLRVSVQN